MPGITVHGVDYLTGGVCYQAQFASCPGRSQESGRRGRIEYHRRIVPAHLAFFRGALAQWLAQVAQIYFQPSPWTGLCILSALAVTRPWAALGMGLASCIALAVSRLRRVGGPGGDPASGLWGYNASLTGAGLLTLYPPGSAVLLYLIGVSIASALLSARWVRWGKLPALTAQFVVAMWGARALGPLLGAAAPAPGCDSGLWGLVPCGIGQVTFISGALAGGAVWAAITLHRARDGLWLAIGAATGVLGAAGLGRWLPLAATQSVELAVNLGLIALGLAVFERSLVTRLAGLGLGAALCLGLGWARVPYFTLPFNLVVWALWTPRGGPARRAGSPAV